VERGRVRKDIEEDYLMRSRTRALNALDLRAKIAANVRIRERVLEVVERHGGATVEAAMQAVISYTVQKLRTRLRELPDGTWYDTAWLDYNDRGETSYYACHLAMTKRGEHLTFDFSGSSQQAQGVINCSIATLEAMVLQTVLADLCFGLPWCPAAVLRVMDVRVEPGTFVSAVWPAAVSKSTSAASQTARQSVNLCLSKLFAASEKYRSRLLATCQGYNAVQELGGIDQRGEPFAAPIIDVSLSGGYGARSFRDGIDVAGSHGSPHVSIANVETYEFRYPLLYLARRQEPDTGGAGEFRGGVGMSALFAPHGVSEIPSNVMHTLGFAYPSTRGLCGGYPGSTNQYQLKRGSDLAEQLAAGRLPQSLDELAGTLEVPSGMSLSYLKAGDVYFCVNSGGGGFSDPLERDPELVARDVRQQLVTREWAAQVYGVVIRGDGDAVRVDILATEGLRAEQLANRRETARRWFPRPVLPPRDSAPARVRPVTPIPAQGAGADVSWVRCRRCAEPSAHPEQGLHAGRRFRERAVQEVGPYTLNLVPDPAFVLREFFCPGCFRLVDVEVVWQGGSVAGDGHSAEAVSAGRLEEH
jgi:N-methylhydantoinase B